MGEPIRMPDEAQPERKPNPGSREAGAAGCLCPVLDNAHGLGRFGDGERFGWWMSSACPMHGGEDDRASS